MPQLGEACLADVLPFDHLAHERAVNDARNVLDRVSPKAGDARVLVAAARLAFAENPERYVASGAQKRLLDALLRVRASGVRGGARDGGADAAARLAVHDAAAGRRLGERLLAPRAP